MTGILAFHDLDDRLRAGITNVSPQSCMEHLDWMLEQGYSFCALDDILNKKQTERVLAVTFDDAMENQVAAALPILAARSIPATLFAIAFFPGRRPRWDYLTGSGRHADWGMLREWLAAGHRIGSHGCTHRDLRGLSDAERTHELVNSRSLLEDRLQQRVETVSYPFGRYDQEVLKSASDAGYRLGVTTRAGLRHGVPLALPRVMVSRLDTSISLEQRLQPTWWGHVERQKQGVVRAWAGGTIALQRLRGDYRASGPPAARHAERSPSGV